MPYEECMFDEYIDHVDYRNPHPDFIEMVGKWRKPSDIPEELGRFFTIEELTTAYSVAEDVFLEYGDPRSQYMHDKLTELNDLYTDDPMRIKKVIKE